MLNLKKLAYLALPLVAAMALPTLVAAEAKPSHATATNTTAKTAPKRSAKPTASKGAHKQPVTISITSRIRQGNLVVYLDDVPVFNEKFEKPALLISQTTKWDPLQVTAGKHTLAATVYGANGKRYLSGVYELEISREKGLDLRIRMKGDTLTVEPES